MCDYSGLVGIERSMPLAGSRTCAHAAREGVLLESCSRDHFKHDVTE